MQKGVHLNGLQPEAERLQSEAKTAMWLALNGEAVGVIAVADTIKEGSREAIAAMKKLGLHVAMITGDNEATARAIAAEAGVDEVFAGAARRQGRVRAPAAGAGSRSAWSATASTTRPRWHRRMLASPSARHGRRHRGGGCDADARDLRSVPQALRLSRATINTIKENLFWAFGYNTILIGGRRGAVPVRVGAGYPAAASPHPRRVCHGVQLGERGAELAAAAAQADRLIRHSPSPLARRAGELPVPAAGQPEPDAVPSKDGLNLTISPYNGPEAADDHRERQAGAAGRSVCSRDRPTLIPIRTAQRRSTHAIRDNHRAARARAGARRPQPAGRCGRSDTEPTPAAASSLPPGRRPIRAGNRPPNSRHTTPRQTPAKSLPQPSRLPAVENCPSGEDQEQISMRRPGTASCTRRFSRSTRTSRCSSTRSR